MREQVNDFLRKSPTKDTQAGHQIWQANLVTRYKNMKKKQEFYI